MNTQRRAGMRTVRSANIRKRIARNRRRATWVGFIYLVGIFALAAAACLPLIAHDLAPIGVTEFYKVFLDFDLNVLKADNNYFLKVLNCGVYSVMLLALVINAFKALSKLKWLFKKRGSKTYGFNRNVYAMEDLGNIFSGSFALMIICYIIMGLLCGELALEKWAFIVLGGGVGLHLLTGFWGAKTGYYDIQRGEVIESPREIGRFAPMLRNVLQLAAVFGIIYLIDYAGLHKTIVSAMSVSGVKALVADTEGLIIFGAQMVAGVCLFVLIKHATGIAEFGIDGAYGEGMKNFRIFSFLLLLAAGGAAVAKYLFLDGKPLDKNLLVVAAIGLVMLVIEIIMRKMPKFPEDKKEKTAIKVSDDEEEEFYL